ncbi:MAG: peptidase S8 [Candidatus Eremiobacteraeota bacterium]|nr:peptidase S8 [Candidatus Eremiobacteraeota bacterium]
MIQRASRLAVVLAFLSFAGCAAPNAVTALPSQAGAAHSPARKLHADNGAGALPGNGAGALPGNGASALPGALLPCVFSNQPGLASCTIAINLNVPVLSDSTLPASLIPGLHPSDLVNAYAMPSANAGKMVAVVDAYDDPTAESDLAIYRLTFGLPPCTSLNGCFKKVNESGTSAAPSTDSAWAQEIALDLDMISAVCPNCSIELVEANSNSIDDLGTSVDRAVAAGAAAVSNSYYTAEWAGETSEDVHYRHSGVAITASSGDAAQPFYPAASPYVTAVGGTSLSRSAGAWQETPWAYGGSGCSAYEPRPSFQTGVPCSNRASVDVSAVADPQTGVAIFSTAAGGWVVAGGTSIGAPILAAAYALAGSGPGPGYSYAHPGGFRDLPPPGYDLATGLGSPRGIGGL